MANCPAFDPNGPYITQMVSFVDCHSLALGVDGYRALGPSTTFGMALSGVLTIYVALIGYRLLLGGTLSLQTSVFVMLRLGFVLALATQWSAYQPLVYDLATAEPSNLAAQVLAPGGLGGENQVRLVERTQAVHDAMDDLVHPRPASVLAPAQLAPQGTGAAQPPSASTAPSVASTIPVDARAEVAAADRMLVMTVLGGVLPVRLITALLLALGPLFIACFLFDGTRGLFVGWVRVLTGTALAAIAVPMVVALELAIIEPQEVALRALLDASQPLGSLPDAMLTTCSFFAVTMVATVTALAYVAFALRLTSSRQQETGRSLASKFQSIPALATQVQTAQANGYSTGDSRNERSRSQQMADAVYSMQRRDPQLLGESTSATRDVWLRDGSPQRQGISRANLPLGQVGRRSGRRLSSSASRRDGA